MPFGVSFFLDVLVKKTNNIKYRSRSKPT